MFNAPLSFPVLAALSFAGTAVVTTVEGGVSRVFDFSNRNFKATACANAATLATSLYLRQVFPTYNLVGPVAHEVVSYYAGQKIGRDIDPGYNHIMHKITVAAVLIPIIIAAGACYDSYQNYLSYRELSKLTEAFINQLKNANSTFANCTALSI